MATVKIDRLPGTGNVVLNPTGDLVLYYDYAKTTPIPLQPDGLHTLSLPLVNNAINVFVDWAFLEHGTAILSLEDATSFAVLDSVRFHTFKSVVAIFGGRGQDPHDTDGDGSIGDVVAGANREGIFDLAQNLRDTGWNVLAFETPAARPPVPIGNVIGLAESEIVNEVTYQDVADPFDLDGGVSIMGYSWGGGAAHDLIESLTNISDQGTFFTTYGVFLDAVVYGDEGSIFPPRFPAPQNDWPNETAYLLNIYQQRSGLGGAPIDPATVTPGATLEDVNTTTAPGFPGNLTHYSIDDDPQVKARIFLDLNQLMLR